MADTRTRIINLPEATTLDPSMNFVEDSADGSGTRRVTYDTLKGAINQEGAVNLAPAYSNAATYNVGDLCTYQGTLYKCNTQISTAEDWTAAHWTLTDMASDLYQLKSDLNDVVPYPESPDSKYGTAGQLLRTKGNGKTEWVDEGLPTDEQTAEAVTAWLNDHPEATTTVQDGSLTEEKFSNALKLKAIKDYVTPQMFGAVGDGVTDDTNSFVSMFQGGYKIIQFGAKKTYKILSPITIGDEVEIYGNGATLQGGLNSLFTVADTCHSFHMEDVHFEIDGSSETVVDNYCIAFNSNSENPVKWGQCQNIEIRNCTFNGGTFHIVLNYATNSLIESCVFYDSYVNPSHYAGGYSVLLQSSWDTTIKNCRFISGQYNRHSIYVSVYRAVELPCENTVITENIFDNTNIGTVSSTTISLMIRGNKNLILANNVFIKSVGFTITSSDFDCVGQHIYSNSFYDVPYFDATNYPLQDRYTINVKGNASNKMEVNIHDNVQYSLDTTRLGNKVYISIDNATSAIVTNNKALTTSGIILFDSHVMIDGYASMKRNEAVIVYSACTGYVRNLQTLDASGWNARAISINNGKNVDIDFVPPEYVKYSYAKGSVIPIRKEGLPITVSVANELLTIDLPWCNTSKLWGKYNSYLTIARLTRNSESIGGFTGYIRDTGDASIQSTDTGMLEIFKWR